MPVSAMLMAILTPSETLLPRKRRVTPPIDVNLMALLTRFITTRRNFSSSHRPAEEPLKIVRSRSEG